MVQDPYKVLGIQRGASKEEIKKAYRKKAKECHPDFHPDDPKASEKMNEVNEAYDMLTNPDKYSARREEEQRRQSYSNPYGSGYSGYYRENGNSSYGSGGYSSGYSSGNGYKGAGGWYSDFGGFDWSDFFGGGFYGSQSNANTAPEYEAGDPAEFQNAVNAIKNGRYHDAINILSQVRSTGRNARFYYLCGVAYNGAGNRSQATECMLRAVRMDPNNQIYHTLLNRYRQADQTVNREPAYATQTGCSSSILFKFFIGFMILQIISRFFMCGFRF